MRILPAEAYENAPDLWLVTSLFNPAGYRSKPANYRVFRERIRRSGLKLLTVECAFGEQPYTLPAAPDVLRVRGRDVMWQKERLLNLAIASLPPHCAKVAWVDCDVLFSNPAWAVETSHLLERYQAVQPFDRAIRLPAGALHYDNLGEVLPGFGAVHAVTPAASRSAVYDDHGDTGFAWAARRELVARHGLYDACIAGGADHLMCHAMSGDWESPCLDIVADAQAPYRRHFMDWAERFHGEVGGSIGHVPGALLHLWHGSLKDRGYPDRHRHIARFGFDPGRDLRIGASGCWEWASGKHELHRWAAAYFAQRREDATAQNAGQEAG